MNDLELLESKIEPPRFAVVGLVPEGLTILAGQPKAGKSFSALDAAMSVASGGPFLGFDTGKAADVLYMALEDSPYRLQKRVSDWVTDREESATGNIEFVTEWPSVQDGGLALLEDYFGDFPNLRMVVIDTLAKFQPVSNSYNKAYPSLTKLSEIGRKHHVAILCVHHAYRGLRASGSKPAIESIQGSIGASAAADALLVLARETDSNNGVMRVTGKDVETSDIPLKWKSNGGGWRLAGEDTQSRKEITPIRKAILQYLSDCPSSDARDIATGIGKPYESIRQLLWQMRDGGLLVREGGKYSLANAEPMPDLKPLKDEANA